MLNHPIHETYQTLKKARRRDERVGLIWLGVCLGATILVALCL